MRYLQIAALGTRTAFEAGSVLVVDAERTVLASSDPDAIDTRFAVDDSPVLTGRSWVGERPYDGRPAAVAMVPLPIRTMVASRPYFG